MVFNIEYKFDGKNVPLKVWDRIPLVDIDEIANVIADAVFPNGKYTPSRFEYYYWSMIIGRYTDFDFTSVTADGLAEMIDSAFDGVDIKEESFLGGICKMISPRQLKCINDASLMLINARLNEHPLTKVCDDVHELLGSIKKIVNKISEDDSLIPALSSFVGVDEDVFAKLVSAFAKND